MHCEEMLSSNLDYRLNTINYNYRLNISNTAQKKQMPLASIINENAF